MRPSLYTIYFSAACKFSKTYGTVSNWRSHIASQHHPYLELNLGLGNVPLAAVAAGNLLGLGDLRPDGIGAEILQGISLDGVDAQERAGLDNGEAARH